jgi:hypothetical protein
VVGIAELIGKKRNILFSRKTTPPFRWDGVEMTDDQINEMCQNNMWKFYKKHGIDFRSPAKEKWNNS